MNLDHPQRGPVFALLTLAACSPVREDAARGEDEGRYGHGHGGQGGVLEGCGAYTWAGPAEPKRDHSCFPVMYEGTLSWTCTCDGATKRSIASTCESALMDVCGVPVDARSFCGLRDLGDCWPDPTGPERHLCRCGTVKEVTPVTASTCQGAIRQLCSMACQAAQDSCVPRQGEAAFDCLCRNHYMAAQARRVPAASCLTALEECEPQGGFFEQRDGARVLAGCQTPHGYCDRTSDHWACTCVDGSQGGVSIAEAGEACWAAAEESCGAVAVPEDRFCEAARETGGTTVSGRCLRIHTDGAFFYTCECTGGESREFKVAAAATTCPQALSGCFPS